MNPQNCPTKITSDYLQDQLVSSSIFHINVQGLSNKLDELEFFLHNNKMHNRTLV